MQKGALQIVIGIIVAVLVIGGGAYYLGTKQAAAPVEDPNELEIVATTSKKQLPKAIDNEPSLAELYTQVQNSKISEYIGKYGSSEVTLKNGRYEYDSEACFNAKCYIQIAPLAKIVMGDLSNDGRDDLVVPYEHWNGGNKSTFGAAVYLNEKVLKYVGNIYMVSPIEIKIEKGLIVGSHNTVYKGAAGYDTPKSFSYRVEAGKLVEIK